MYEIAVFAALDWERQAVTAALADVEPAGVDRAWRGGLADGAPCLVVQTGIGPDRAREAAAAAPPARLFVSCGCAGALVDWLRAGDLVAADGVIPLDAMGRPDPRLPAAGRPVAAWAAGRGFRVHVGSIASSGALLSGGASKAVGAATGALAVEMESGAIAAEAAARGVPFVGLRVILDEAGQRIPVGLDVVDETTGELRAARALAGLAPRPWLWAATIRLARQRRRAERRLVAFLAALLGAGGASVLAGPAEAAHAVSG